MDDTNGALTVEALLEYMQLWDMVNNITLQQDTPDQHHRRHTQSGSYSTNQPICCFHTAQNSLAKSKETTGSQPLRSIDPPLAGVRRSPASERWITHPRDGSDSSFPGPPCGRWGTAIGPEPAATKVCTPWRPRGGLPHRGIVPLLLPRWARWARAWWPLVHCIGLHALHLPHPLQWR